MEQDRLNNRNEQAQLDPEVTRKRRAHEQQKRLYDEKLTPREDYLQSKEDYERTCRAPSVARQPAS